MKPKVRGPSVPVLDFLQREGGAADLLPAAKRLIDLAKDVDRLLPAALASACEVIDLGDGVLRIDVGSAGVAAKLRQTLPRLERGLADAGWQVASIRLRIRPRTGRAADESDAPRGGSDLSSEGVAAFERLEDALDDSPLRDAVHRLLAKRRR